MGRETIQDWKEGSTIVPDEFKKLSIQFQQELLAYHGTPEKMIVSAVRDMNQKDRATVRDFLDDLLNGTHDMSLIEEVWNQTSADFFLANSEQLVTFLKMVQKTVTEFKEP